MNDACSTQNFRLIACPHVLSADKDKIDVQRPAGGSVSDLLASIGWTDRFSARVFLDGELVLDARWEYTLPKAGQSLVVRAIPMGGGENGKSVLRIVAMIAIVAAAIAAPYSSPFIAMGLGAGTIGGAIASAAISLIGTLAMSGLIPPPLPRRALPRSVDDRRQVAA